MWMYVKNIKLKGVNLLGFTDCNVNLASILFCDSLIMAVYAWL